MMRAKNKISTTLLAVTMAFSLTACTNQDDIDSAVTPLSGQITTINLTLNEMQTLDTTLDGYIDTLESKVATLETNLTAVNAALESLEENSATKTALTETKSALESEINAIKKDIAALEAKDTELDGKITELQTALSTEITDTEKWVNDTFSTKTACDTLKTEINASIAELQGKIGGLETSVDNLETTVNGLQQDMNDVKDGINDLQETITELEIRINCLEGNHETTTSYVYTCTWSETAPTSTKNYTCLHCEKVIKETVSPSVWQVGDKVTYIAKDGKDYVSTVGEIANGKAVLVSDAYYTKLGKYTETKLLELLEPVGARFPIIGEKVYTTIIESWLMEKLNSIYSVVRTEDLVAYKYLYKYDGNMIIGDLDAVKTMNVTWIYRYIWDIEFSTAE